MANEKRLKCCEDCIHFLACVPYAEDVGASYDWQIEWARDCELYEYYTNRVRAVHGRWVMTLYTTTSKRGRVVANKKFACSVCGYKNGRKQSNYCPNCGAKMDGGNEGGE